MNYSQNTENLPDSVAKKGKFSVYQTPKKSNTIKEIEYNGSRYAPFLYPITIPAGILISAYIGLYALLTLRVNMLRERRESSLERKLDNCLSKKDCARSNV